MGVKMRRFLALAVVALPAALAVHGVAVSSDATVEAGWPPLKVNGGFTPTELPRHQMAPITVTVSGEIATGTSQSPALREATFFLDRNGDIDAGEFPVCSKSKAEANGALRRCQAAIVGNGLAHIALGPTEPIPVPLALVNGGAKGRTAALFVLAPRTVATPESIVATVKLTSIDRGPYGLQAVAKVPPIAEGHGSLLDFTVTLERYRQHGVVRSYAKARCINGLLRASVAGYAFGNGETFTGVPAPRTCIRRTDG